MEVRGFALGEEMKESMKGGSWSKRLKKKKQRSPLLN